jgi:hypothetical protein
MGDEPIIEQNLHEIWRWTDVMPGDVVQSRGTQAYRQRDFIGRDADTRVLRLYGAPVLCLARFDGIPGEAATEGPSSWPAKRTFVCLSRHGIIVVVQNVAERRTQGT